MLNSKTRWLVKRADERAVQTFIRELGLDPLLAKLLAVRGITTKEQAEMFLYGGPGQFRDPFLLDGMREAVQRIRLALERGEKIRIYGDYDADGVSATALMIHTLKMLGARFDYYIPHRATEGYGLNIHAVRQAKEEGVQLLLTVDTGISAREEIAYARELGMDVVVTDHHEVPEVLPEAWAVVNPKKPNCPYPFKELAGVGVAFKLAHALLGRCPMELSELAAIGTVSDLMPLVDENRILVKLGLERMNRSVYAGIRALLSAAGIDGNVSAVHIGFALGPRINAGGRLETASDALRLLITEEEEEAFRLAQRLDALNRERQRMVDEMTEQAEAMLAKDGPLDKVIVLAHEDWNPGVVGIAASRLLEKYYRPTIILGIDKETQMAKGSARSIHGFDIYRALSECGELFEHFGGHQAAAGMSMEAQNIPRLKSRLNDIAAERLKDEDFIPVMQGDLECALREIASIPPDFMALLEPFGPGNPSPKIVLTGVELDEIQPIGKDGKHLKLVLSQSEPPTPPTSPVRLTLGGVGFGMGSLYEDISPDAKLDVFGELAVNEWKGKVKLQILIKDLRIPYVQVFDWRKIADPIGKIDALAKKAADGKGKGTVALVTFAGDEHGAHVRKEWTQAFSCWMAQKNGTSVTMIPLNEGAETVLFRENRELIFLTLPPSLEMFRAVLGQAVGAEKVYAVFQRAKPKGMGVVPNRESFKEVYVLLHRLKQWNAKDGELLNHLSRKTGLSVDGIRFILEVFEELSFIERNGDGCRLVANPIRRELASSSRYRQEWQLGELERVLVHSQARELRDWIWSQLGNRTVLEGIL